MKQFTLHQYVKLCLTSLLLIICFSYIYLKISAFFGHPWLGVAAINTAIACLVAYRSHIYFKKNNLTKNRINYKKINWFWYLPTFTVLAIALLLQISAYSWHSIHWKIDLEQIAFIFWIPIIEEFIFRSGIANALISFSTPLLGHFFAALIFALVHNFSALESNNIVQLFNLPLGAFLLGICCSYLYFMAKDIKPAILFHMACNATVVILGSNDAIWLKKFHFLYQ